jgi:hypothetical protein
MIALTIYFYQDNQQAWPGDLIQSGDSVKTLLRLGACPNPASENLRKLCLEPLEKLREKVVFLTEYLTSLSNIARIFSVGVQRYLLVGWIIWHRIENSSRSRIERAST